MGGEAMTRRRWTALRRADLFMTHDGICHICGGKIGIGEPWDIEHVIPLALGGDDDEANCRPAHVACHKDKTADDKAQIAKANRVRAKHLGARERPRRIMAGSKLSPWKKRLDGTVVRRDTP